METQMLGELEGIRFSQETSAVEQPEGIRFQIRLNPQLARLKMKSETWLEGSKDQLSTTFEAATLANTLVSNLKKFVPCFVSERCSLGVDVKRRFDYIEMVSNNEFAHNLENERSSSTVQYWLWGMVLARLARSGWNVLGSTQSTHKNLKDDGGALGPQGQIVVMMLGQPPCSNPSQSSEQEVVLPTLKLRMWVNFEKEDSCPVVQFHITAGAARVIPWMATHAKDTGSGGDYRQDDIASRIGYCLPSLALVHVEQVVSDPARPTQASAISAKRARLLQGLPLTDCLPYVPSLGCRSNQHSFHRVQPAIGNLGAVLPRLMADCDKQAGTGLGSVSHLAGVSCIVPTCALVRDVIPMPWEGRVRAAGILRHVMAVIVGDDNAALPPQRTEGPHLADARPAFVEWIHSKTSMLVPAANVSILQDSCGKREIIPLFSGQPSIVTQQAAAAFCAGNVEAVHGATLNSVVGSAVLPAAGAPKLVNFTFVTGKQAFQTESTAATPGRAAQLSTSAADESDSDLNGLTDSDFELDSLPRVASAASRVNAAPAEAVHVRVAIKPSKKWTQPSASVKSTYAQGAQTSQLPMKRTIGFAPATTLLAHMHSASVKVTKISVPSSTLAISSGTFHWCMTPVVKWLLGDTLSTSITASLDEGTTSSKAVTSSFSVELSWDWATRVALCPVARHFPSAMLSGAASMQLGPPMTDSDVRFGIRLTNIYPTNRPIGGLLHSNTTSAVSPRDPAVRPYTIRPFVLREDTAADEKAEQAARLLKQQSSSTAGGMVDYDPSIFASVGRGGSGLYQGQV